MGAKTGKNTRHVQAHLNYQYELEALALSILSSHEDKGLSQRHVITDALIRLGDTTPEYYHDGGTVEHRLMRIEEKIERNHEAMLNQFMEVMQLVKSNPVARQALISDMSNEKLELGDDVKENIANMFNLAKGGE